MTCPADGQLDAINQRLLTNQIQDPINMKAFFKIFIFKFTNRTFKVVELHSCNLIQTALCDFSLQVFLH